MIFETESGSTYEVDLEGGRIRRLSGRKPGTSRQGADGVWYKYLCLWPESPREGSSVIITWDLDANGADFLAKSTITSRVTCVRSE